MKESVKDRLILFINSKNLSKNRFESLCGLSKRYVSNIRNSIQPGMIEKITLKFPDLNAGWLLSGEGEMLKEAVAAGDITGDGTVVARSGNIIGGGNRISGSGKLYNIALPEKGTQKIIKSDGSVHIKSSAPSQIQLDLEREVENLKVLLKEKESTIERMERMLLSQQEMISMLNGLFMEKEKHGSPNKAE